MKIEKFEDIIAWQKAQDFAVRIYAAFDKIKDFGFFIFCTHSIHFNFSRNACLNALKIENNCEEFLTNNKGLRVVKEIKVNNKK